MEKYDPLRDPDVQMCSWNMYPMRIVEDPKVLEENIVMDSPGFEPRDLRYWPKMEPCDPHEIPTFLELAWVDKIYYEERAKARAEGMHEIIDERHELNTHKAFTRRIYGAEPHEYTLYDEWILDNIIEAFDCGIGFYDPDDHFMLSLKDWRAFYEAIDLDPNKYIRPEERHYRDGVEKVIRFILMAKTQYPGRSVNPTKEVMDAYDEVEFIINCIKTHINIDFSKGAHNMKVNFDLAKRCDDVTFYKRQRFNLKVDGKIIDCFPTDRGKGSKYNIDDLPAEEQIELYRLDDEYRRWVDDAIRKRSTPGDGQILLKKHDWPIENYIPAYYDRSKIRKEKSKMKIDMNIGKDKAILAKRPIVRRKRRGAKSWNVYKSPQDEYDAYRSAIRIERQMIFMAAENNSPVESNDVSNDETVDDDSRNVSRTYYDDAGAPHTEVVHFSEELFDENLKFIQPDYYRDEKPDKEKKPKDLNKYMRDLVKGYYAIQEYIGALKPNKKKYAMKLDNAQQQLKFINAEIIRLKSMGIAVPKGYKRKGFCKKIKAIFKRKTNSIYEWCCDNAGVIKVWIGLGVACLNLIGAVSHMLKGVGSSSDEEDFVLT